MLVRVVRAVFAIALGVAVLGLPRVARAAPGCTSLDQAEFRALVLDAQSAIDRDDAALHAAIVGEVTKRVPCMTFAPSPRLWADYLVGVAIVQFSEGGDWQTPMGAALRVRPGVDRGVGGGHPLATWTPEPATEPSAGPVPDDITIYVDGLPVEELPPAQGLYLVQRTDGGYWSTLLLHDAAIPEDWLTSAIDAPLLAETWVAVGFALSGGVIGQSYDACTFVANPPPPPCAFTSDFVARGARLLPMTGVRAQGAVKLGWLALLGDARIDWSALARAGTGRATASLATPRRDALFGIGVGLGTIEVFEGAAKIEDAEARPIAQPVGTASWLVRKSERWDWDYGVSALFGFAMGRLDAHLGAAPPVRRLPWRYGGSMTIVGGGFTQEGFRGREVSTLSVRLGVDLGLVFKGGP